MENATDALKMAFAVVVFVMALTIAVMMFSQLNQVSKLVVSSSDITKYYEYKIAKDEEQTRIVGLETIIPTLYKYYKENYKSTIELFKTTTDTVVDYEFLIANNLIKTFPGYAFASFTGGVVIGWHKGTEEDPYSTVEIRYNRLHYGLTLRSDESNGAVSFVPEDDGVENSFSTMTTKDGKEYRIYYQIPFKVRLTLKEGYMSTGFTARAYKVEGSKDFTANSKVCDYVEENVFTVKENGDVYYGSVKILSIVDGKYYAGDLEVCDVVEGATFDTTKVDGLYYNGYAVLTKQNDGYYARTRQLLGDLTLKADGFYLGDNKLFGFVFDENDNSYKIAAMPYYAIEITAEMLMMKIQQHLLNQKSLQKICIKSKILMQIGQKTDTNSLAGLLINKMLIKVLLKNCIKQKTCQQLKRFI